MKGGNRGVVLTMIVGTVALGVTLASPAQEKPPDTIVEVRVEGNRVLSDSEVLSHVKVRPGRPYSEQVVRDDEQRLLKTRRFDSVTATKTQTDRGIVVTFTVVERPAVGAVRLVGNKAIESKKLLAVLTFAAGDPIDPYQVSAGARAIRSEYRSGGFYFAKVTVDEAALKDKRQVLYRIEEGPKVTLRKIRFRGNKAFSNRQLLGSVASRARFWPFRAGTLDAETIERDVVNLQTFYHSKGYLDVEAGHLPLKFSPEKRKAELIFVIREGPRYRIRATVFEGATVFSHDQLAGQLKLVAGELYDQQALDRDTAKLRALYGEIGYIETQVTVKRRFAAPTDPVPEALKPLVGDKPALVDLVYRVEESQQFRVGRIDIRGNKATKMNVIRRHVQFFPGQLYNMVAADETRLRLRETGLFETVEITPYGTDAGVRNARVEVAEARTAQFLIGVGVSSNTGLLGNISFTERNFDIAAWPRSWEDVRSGRAWKGGGQTFRISAEPGTDFMRFRVDWREPYLFDRPYSLGTSLFVFTSGRETYDETRYGGLLSVGHRFRNRWYGELSGRIEGVDVSSIDRTKAPPDVRSVAGTSSLAGVKATLVRDRTDSRWLPSRGDRISFHYEQVAGDFSFGRAGADYRIYRTVHRDALDRKHILAARVASGGIFGDAPVFERFYGGGLGSVRGFRYRGISPRQGRFRQVVGGEFTVFAGGEYTFPLFGENFRGVVFLDTGTVESEFEITDYRAAVGFGFRMHVPFFGPVPLSFDFAFPISKGDADDTQVFNFSFGWAF